MPVAESERDRAATEVAWFVALRHARLRGDRRSEAEARRELDHLGVTVRFQRSPKGGVRC